MVFSSAVFLFFFLPLVFLLSRLPFGRRWQNLLLAGASLIFYAFGNLHYVPLFLGSVLLNWLAGVLLSGRFQRSRVVLAVSVALNLGILCIYKYTDFLLQNLSLIPGLQPSARWPSASLRYFVFYFSGHALCHRHLPPPGKRNPKFP